MLTPVPDHQAQTHEEERDPEGEDGCLGTDAKGHVVQEHIARRFRQESLDSQIRLSLAEEVHRQIQPDKKEEPPKILSKTPRRVALIPDRRRQIIRPVAFDMVMLDVVVIVRVPSMAHQRLEHIRKGDVKPVPVLGQDAIIVDMVVHEQGERAGAPKAVDRMEYPVEVGEVVEEVDGTGDIDTEVEKNVGEEDDVSGMSGYACCPASVGFDDCFVEPWWEVLFVEGDEDRGLEVGTFGVVQGMEAGKRFLVAC